MTKNLRGTICTSVPLLHILGDLSPRPPVIYAHARGLRGLLRSTWHLIGTISWACRSSTLLRNFIEINNIFTGCSFYITTCFHCIAFCACGVLESVRRQVRLSVLTWLNVTLSPVKTLHCRAFDRGSAAGSCPPRRQMSPLSSQFIREDNAD